MDDQGDRPPAEPVDAAAATSTESNASRRVKIAGGVAGAVAVGTAIGVVALGKSLGATPTTAPAGSILVNGAVHKVQSAPDTPLLYVLRDELGLHGPKFGCGLGQCGACSVLVGDKETRSCITTWTGVSGPITTLEGLPARWAAQKGPSSGDTDKALHPVQQAWIDQQVPQCGYCQNGMMIMAVDLLHRTPNPSEAQIRDAYTNTPPSPHLCRCGTYVSIIAAVQRAAKAMA